MIKWLKKQKEHWDERHYGHKCIHCGERALDEYRTNYTRAYNALCHQAAGEYGVWCNNCCKVNFDTIDEDKWINSQPAWIVPYHHMPKDWITNHSPNDCYYRSQIAPFAVFAIALKRTQVAATTRPYDELNSFGLPGGKVDPGETPIEAVNRECQEEGWNIVIPEDTKPFHYEFVNGKMVHWYLADYYPEMLNEYKEKEEGIVPIFKDLKFMSTTGYGNECLKKLFFIYNVDNNEKV